MANPSVAFDESGNTGADLLNEPQPIFALASVRLNNSQTEGLLKPSADLGKEAKFSTLRSSPEGRDAVLRVLRSGVLTPDTARVSVFHKPYMVVAKMVDLLMEPAFYKRGLRDELFADDGALKWPTALYELGQPDLGSLWPDLVESFVATVRKPSSNRLASFMALVEAARQESDDSRIQFALEVFAEQAPVELARTPPIDPLDPAIPALVEHINFWSAKLGPFAVQHDEAPALQRFESEFLKLCAPDVKAEDYDLPPNSVNLPLKVTEIEFVHSDGLPQVQVADLLAGACSYQQGSFEKGSSDARFAQAVAETGVRRLFTHFVAPPEFVRRSMVGAL